MSMTRKERALVFAAFIIVVVWAIYSTLFGAEPTYYDLSGQPIKEERVTDLPEFSRSWFLTVVYSDPMGERDRKLHEFLRSNRQLQNLVKQVVFTEWNNSDAIVKHTAWKTYLGPQRPAVLLQPPANIEGRAMVAYYGRGASLPINERLPYLLQAAIDQHTPSKSQRPRIFPFKCPPEPSPKPTIIPEIRPVEPPGPVQPTDPSEGENYIPWWALAIPPAAAGLRLWQDRN